MKRFLLAGFLLILAGAGCLQQGGKQAEVVGDWHLVFDLPTGFITTASYDTPEDSIVSLRRDLSADMTEIIVQNTDKPIVSTGDIDDVSEDVPSDTYTASGYVKVTVLQLDPRRKIPSEAEDLGGGIFKVKLCEDGGGCTSGGKSNYEWYLKTAIASYRFTAVSDGTDFSAVEQIVRGATEATRVE